MDALGDGRYSIRVVEQLTGLTARQIRYYETKGLLAPQRTAGRQRLFSAADVERLQWIRTWRGEGVTLAAIKTRLQAAKPAHAAAGRTPARETDAWARLSRPALTSLYPVSDRGRLMEVMEERHRSRKDGDR